MAKSKVMLRRTAVVPRTTARRLRERFEELLGVRSGSEQEVVHLVERGLPLTVLDRLLERGLSKAEMFDVIIPARTLKHRKSKRQPLSREESERVVRAARVLAKAAAVIGEDKSALAWLRSPKKRFQGRSPIEMLTTEPGGRLVEEMLIQIDEGMFA
jgi:putative toxin-antitoxin system antitoxin component (TIGR02293 family)